MTSISDRMAKLGPMIEREMPDAAARAQLARLVDGRKPQRPDRREGWFQLGDKVEWSASGAMHRGEIVEVVKWGRYPETRVTIHGFYREHFSYVVRDNKARYYWPRVGTLRRVEP